MARFQPVFPSMKKVELPSNRSFGTLFGVVFTLLGGYWWWRNNTLFPWAFALAALTLVVTLAKPDWLGPANRAWMKLDAVLTQHAGGRIVIFSHTGTICILALHLMGALDAPELKPVWISTSNCGINRFEIREDGFIRVTAINDTRHLIGIH